MDDLVRETLKRLVSEHGTELCLNQQRLEGLLRDFCGQHRREIKVLITSIQEGITDALLQVSGTEVDPLLAHRLVQRLHEGAGIDKRYSEWAVNTWAIALGKSVPERLEERAEKAHLDDTIRLRSGTYRQYVHTGLDLDQALSLTRQQIRLLRNRDYEAALKLLNEWFSIKDAS